MSSKNTVRSGIRTHAHRSGLRPERSALDHSAILTLKSQQFDASFQTLIIQTIKQKISPEQGLEPWTVRLKA